MLFKKQKCPNPECGAEVKSDQKFCLKCGEKLPGGTIRCTCGQSIPANAKFCTSCGRETKDTDATSIINKQPNIVHGKWARAQDDFAARVEASDLKGIFTKGLVIEPGTTALLFAGGKHEGTLESGSYDLGGLKKKIVDLNFSKKYSAVLIDSSDVPFDIIVNKIYTKDDLPVDIEVSLSLKISKPLSFFQNLFKSRLSFPISEFKGILFKEMQNYLNGALSKINFEELSTSRDSLERIENGLSEHMKASLERNGIMIVQLRALDFRQEGMEWQRERKAELRQKKEELWLDRKDDELEIEDLENRLDLGNKLRESKNLDQMSLLKNEDEIEKFKGEMGLSSLMRESEFDKMKKIIVENKDDRESVRNHLLNEIEINRKHDLEILSLKLKGELNKASNQQEVSDVQHKLSKMSMLKESERTQLELGVITELKIKNERLQSDLDGKLKSAKNESEIRSIEREQDRLDDELDQYEAQLGLKTLAQMKAVNREDEEERLKIQREHEAFMRKLDMEEKAHDVKLEKEKIDALSNASVEVLISQSGPEQSKMLAELRNTEVMKEMTDDQILALAAKDSDAVAEAFKEKYKSTNSEEVKKQYEKMLSIKDEVSGAHKDALDRNERIQKDMMESLERIASAGMTGKIQSDQEKIDAERRLSDKVEALADKSIDKMADVASSKARGPAGGHGLIICKHCHSELNLASDLKFCSECGKEIS